MTQLLKINKNKRSEMLETIRKRLGDQITWRVQYSFHYHQKRDADIYLRIINFRKRVCVFVDLEKVNLFALDERELEMLADHMRDMVENENDYPACMCRNNSLSGFSAIYIDEVKEGTVC
ncbi:hypothetical protein GCM10010965_27510 [Caldalkalibacillus thermarum]|uniref:hypothetical protein n=1 Tax=Caldalkalibacillus thermarum TaxID=296745 RepID=UPI00166ADC64|nr:hypothetical protein [Caldalkalibacillus thermarum]GGK33172.1 hypothetical protein GCM10010965_27510 [Caldalkalibacillus thermarum]